MRLSEKEIKVLKEKLHSISPDAKIYLFGSRTDDSKRGGDIDLLIVGENITRKDLRALRVEFYKHFGEQKIDIVLDNKRSKNAFIEIIRKQAVEL
ncbi:nucleotidyltransferase domain-containing protein [Nitratiruptor sp. YY09-18]|uniref:nucleotidyltransferase domain-containing protein n=1 Tax=Nitratiruptor sp. YY09-18 TaxID=2724901 RepID=UPI00191679A0|nr:nucleotidyltransferase domain-containing protein [Nitratiruptor sp. YY09-18]BCD67963.1 hypothetical protein NitYY0918_C0871 [Nitratiruptor sp. YY09-18]